MTRKILTFPTPIFENLIRKFSANISPAVLLFPTREVFKIRRTVRAQRDGVRNPSTSPIARRTNYYIYSRKRQQIAVFFLQKTTENDARGVVERLRLREIKTNGEKYACENKLRNNAERSMTLFLPENFRYTRKYKV